MIALKHASGASRVVPIGALSEAQSLRLRRLDRPHVEVVAELAGGWPPILLWGAENRIVDGYHRVAAARMLGMQSIQAEWFEGTSEEAYVEGIRRNTKYGLPLSLRDRVRAARNVLEQQPQWSDRRIAVLCGLSGSTVARVRSESGCDVAGEHGVSGRVGLDGRVRPSRPGDARLRVLSALEMNPHGSLRSIASAAEVSPETVRSVRRRLQAESDADASVEGPPPARAVVFDSNLGDESTVVCESLPTGDPDTWKSDAALTTCDSAESLLEWLYAGSSVYQWQKFVTEVPLGRVYAIADESRRRSKAWARFASALEARANARGSVAS